MASSSGEAVAGGLCAACACFSLVASILTGDYSWVDRLWSLTPWLYAWIFTAYSGFDPRLTLASSLATIWGARLSFNFARKGGYRLGQEDYRWAEIQRALAEIAPRRHRLIWHLFNVSFIAVYQNLLLMSLALPLLEAARSSGHSGRGSKGGGAEGAGGAAAGRLGGPAGLGQGVWARRGAAEGWNWIDVAAAGGFALMLLLEALADEQQWAFQQSKRAWASAKGAPAAGGSAEALAMEGPGLEGDCRRGFLTRGLFRYSRHPNFFAEQAIWWFFYLFSAAAGAPWLNWSAAGPALLTLLFQGSTWFTERISAGKYGSYATYQTTTSRLLPMPPLRPWPRQEGKDA